MDYYFDHLTYGATAGGMTGAAATAKRGAKKGVILNPIRCSRGGMTVGGVGGVMDYIREPHRSGLTLAFYRNIIAQWLAANPEWASKEPPLGQPDSYWNWTPDAYIALDRIYFPPSYARNAFNDMLSGLPITFVDDVWIKEVIQKDDSDMYVMTNGDTYSAPVCHDASYEGDALKASGVSFDYGRDASSTYGEKFAGQRDYIDRGSNRASILDEDGDLWTYLSNMPPYRQPGDGDAFDMGFVYRMTISKHPNRLPFTPPPGFRREHFLGFIESYKLYTKFEAISSYKRITDHLFGTNGPTLPGLQWGYSACKTREERLAYWRLIKYIQQGMYWIGMTDPEMTPEMRADCAAHGLPHDENVLPGEYFETPGWSSCLYTRECGHMVGDRVLTGNHIINRVSAMGLPDPVNLHGYSMDSHPHRRFPTLLNGSKFEGSMADIGGEGLWQVGLSDMLAPVGQAPRLVASWCFSQSRSALCSSRIEPPAQMQGEVAGLINAVALEIGCRPADVPYGSVRAVLDAQGHYVTGYRAPQP